MTVFNEFGMNMRIRKHQLVFFFVIFYLVIFSGCEWLTPKSNCEIFSNYSDKILSKGYLETARSKRKHKFALNLMLGIFMIKSVLIPLVFKAMLIMTGVSVIMSTFSLIIASLIGYSKIAWKHAGPTIKVIEKSHGWSHDDDVIKSYHEQYETMPEIQIFEDDALEHYHYYQK